MRCSGRQRCLKYTAVTLAAATLLFLLILLLRSESRWRRALTRSPALVLRARDQSCETSIAIPEEADEWPIYLDPASLHPTRELMWQHPACAAVVVPFFPSQRARLGDAIDRWGQVPCHRELIKGAPSLPCVDLVLMETRSDKSTAADADAAAVQAIVAAANSSLGSCFRHVRLVPLAIPVRYDTHMDGAAVVFFSLFKELRGVYGHFLLMESDVMPQGPGWVDRIMVEATSNRCCSRFWQAGSPPLCESTSYVSLCTHKYLDFGV